MEIIMKKREVIARILRYHPFIKDYMGCDEYKSGFEDEECTGVISALVPTMEVLEKTVELGCNLLVVHEPIYYQTPDFSEWKGNFDNSVQKEKEKYIWEHRITVWRDHDHMHMHQPDSIFAGVMKYLGWEPYLNIKLSGALPFFYVFDIPECTVVELSEELKEKIGMNGIVSSAIPNTEPQRENRNITIGISNSVLLFIALIILPIPASIALVSCRTAIAPPTMKMKNIICADSCIPLGTAVRNCIRLTGVGSTA